jgi:hypothetical protein
MEFFFVLVEGIRGAGRKGGVVALVLGAIFLAAGVSLAREPRHGNPGDSQEVEFAAGGILLGAGGIVGGLWLLVTGGSAPYEPTGHGEPRPRSLGSGISTTGRRRTTPGRGRSGTPRPPS